MSKVKVIEGEKILSLECNLELAYFVLLHKKHRSKVRAGCFLLCFMVACDVTTELRD